jgi:hypothetical protein
MIPNYSELTPAYGRDYKNKAEVVAAFEGGKDFIFAATGQYTSIKDVAPGTTVLLRYKQKRSVTPYKKKA